MPVRDRAPLLAFALLVAGCASAPAPDVSSPRAPLVQTPIAGAVPDNDLERAIARRRARALKAEQQHDLADAARQWQIVLLLAPRDTQAGERLAAVNAASAQTIKDEMAAAREALRRGETDRAQRALLRVLALDGDHEEALAALREIDRKRELRQASERAERARAGAMTTAAPKPPTRATRDARDFDLEQSLELLRAGDANAALPELRRYVAANRADRAGRTRVASAVHAFAQRLEKQGAIDQAVATYGEAIGMSPSPVPEWSTELDALRMRLAAVEYEKGVRLVATDVGAAIVHFQTALRFAPGHTQAQLQLQRAQKIQQNLKGVPAKSGP